MNRLAKQSGFTIVELLIVIVIIGILAAITVVAYNGVQTRAQETKIKTDIATLVKAVSAARQSEQKTLGGITGTFSTVGACTTYDNDTDLAALGKLTPLPGCWSRYNTTLAIISNTSGVNVNGLIDPWGRPYAIDENEGENGGCGKDTIAAFRNPFVKGYYFLDSTPAGNVPRSSFSGCTS